MADACSVVCSNRVKFRTTFSEETLPSMISPSVVLPMITASGKSRVNSERRVDIKALSVMAEKTCIKREEEFWICLSLINDASSSLFV
jgi:hypothetical protein